MQKCDKEHQDLRAEYEKKLSTLLIPATNACIEEINTLAQRAEYAEKQKAELDKLADSNTSNCLSCCIYYRKNSGVAKQSSGFTRYMQFGTITMCV